MKKDKLSVWLSSVVSLDLSFISVKQNCSTMTPLLYGILFWFIVCGGLKITDPDLDPPLVIKKKKKNKASGSHGAAMENTKEAQQWQDEYDILLTNHSVKISRALQHLPALPVLHGDFSNKDNHHHLIGFVINLDRDKWQWERTLRVFSEFQLYRVPALELSNRYGYGGGLWWLNFTS